MRKIFNALLGFLIIFNSYRLTKLLFWLGADPNGRNKQGQLYFGGAVVFKLLNVVRAFIEHPDFDINLEITKGNGSNGLIFASNMGYVETVKLLLDAGANVHCTTPNGSTPLSIVKRIISATTVDSRRGRRYQKVLQMLEQAAAK